MSKENRVGRAQRRIKPPYVEIKAGPGTTLQKTAWHKLWEKLIAEVKVGEHQ